MKEGTVSIEICMYTSRILIGYMSAKNLILLWFSEWILIFGAVQNDN